MNGLVQLHGVDVLVRLHRGDSTLREGDAIRSIPVSFLGTGVSVASSGARKLTRIP